MNPITKSRYPGIRAFELNERNLFFGRAMESRKLFSLVKAKPLVVLFAKSGIGKSSLINAAVVPRLDQELYRSIRIRVQDSSQDPINTVKAELSKYLNASKLEQFTGKHKGMATLWEYLRACEFGEGDNMRIPILIFDQFEEFFVHPPEVRQELTDEMANLVSERLPEEVRKKLRSVPFKDRSKELLDWCSPIPVKIIMAIRSDRLSLMDELSDEIPSILQNRFHLSPLIASQAKSAILEPARLSDPDFSSPKFEYDELAIQEILESLVNTNGEVESFQLQLVCQYIENEIIERYPKGEEIVVTSDFYGGRQGIDNILHDYYENALRKLKPEEEKKSRIFIEEGLIVDGRRVGINAGVEEKSFGINADLLTKLLHSRLIRAEDTHLGRSYEVSHDTLVEPILRSYEKRKDEEAAAEAEREKEIQAALLSEERRKRRRAMGLAALGFLLFFIAAITGGMAYYYSLQANRQYLLSAVNQYTANAILQSETYGNITLAIDDAELALSLEEETIGWEGEISPRQALLSIAYKNIGQGRYLFYERPALSMETEITAMDLATDSKTIAVACRNGTIGIYDYQSADSIYTGIPIHHGSINRINFSPNGQYLATASKDHTAALMHADGRLIAKLDHDLEVTDIGFSPDGQYLASTSLDQKIKIWDIKGQLIQTFAGGHSMGIRGIQYSGDGERLLTWGFDGLAIVWNKNGEILHRMEHEGAVLDARFSPNGLWVATGSANQDLSIWRSDGTLFKIAYGHKAEVRGLSFSPNSKNILSWDEEGLVIVWTVAGEILTKLENIHKSGISSAQFSEDGEMFLTTSHDNQAKIWSRMGTLLAICSGHDLGINGGCFLPGGKSVLTYSADHSVYHWDIGSTLGLEIGNAHQQATQAIVTADGEQVLVTDLKGLSIWTIEGKLEKQLEGLDYKGITKMLCLSNGQLLMGTQDGKLQFLNRKGQVLRKINHPSTVSSISVSADEKWIAVALPTEKKVLLYDSLGQLQKTLETGKVQKVFFSPVTLGKTISRRGKGSLYPAIDNRHLANLLLMIGEENKVQIWNPESGIIVYSFEVFGTQVLDACFNITGDEIIGGCTDKTIRIWDLRGNLMDEFHGQNAAVFSVDVSEDGSYLVSAAGDGTFVVRDLNDYGRQLVKGSGISKIKPFAQFSYQNKYILSASNNGQIMLWPFSKETLWKKLYPEDLDKQNQD